MFGGTGIFGNNNQSNTQATGGLFGGQTNTSTQGNGIFGGQTQVQSQGAFGAQQGQGGFGMQSQVQQPQGQGIFGNAQGGQGGGIFGGGQNQTQAQGGIFGANNNNNAFSQAKTPGQGLFGSNPQSQQSAFGQPQQSAFGQTQQGSGLFGNTGNTGSTGSGAFGQTANTVFGQQPQQQNVFGQQSQPQNTFGQQQGGSNVFGQTSTFGQNQNQNQGGIFGQANSAFNKPANTFGSTTQGFGGQQQQTGLFGQQQQQGGGLFGAQQQQGAFGSTTNNVFGQNQQQTGFGSNAPTFGNNNAGGGLFGAGQQQPQQGASIFGGNQNQTTSVFGQPQQTGFNFGNQPSTTGFGGAQTSAPTQNSFGNTAWGVPTPAQNTQQLSKFVPLKPKNPKIDSKHVVKCVTLLDENNGFCKKELHARFVLSGGVPQPIQQGIGQQSSFGSAFGNTNTSSVFGGGTAAGQNSGQGQSAFGFSGNTNNTGGSLFGNNPATGAFGQTQQPSAFGQPQTSAPQAGSGLFGGVSSTPAFGQSQPASGGLFGNNANNSFKSTTGGSSLFGNSASSTPAFGAPGANSFGAGTSFGNGATSTPGTGFGSGGNGFSFGNTQPSGGLFAGNTPAPGASFPGSFPASGTSGLFGNPAGGSAFGANTAGTSSFGTTSAFTTPSFGQTQPQSSLFGGGATSFGQTPQSTSGLSNFGNQQGSELTTLLLNGLFNTDFFKQMMGTGNATPFENLVKQIQNTSMDKKFNSFPKTTEETYDNDYGNYYPKWNKYNRNMYSSEINSYNDPYLYTDNDEIAYDRFSDKIHENFGNEAFQAKASTYKKSVIANDRIMDKKPIKREDTERERILPTWHNEAQISRISNILPLQKQPAAVSILSKLGEFEISPSRKQIQQMSPQQLSHVSNVQISNKYGQITFLEPVSLLNKNLTDCVEICQDSIDLCDPEWEGKEKELIFNNFGNYSNLKGEEERTKMRRKINKWINKNGMIEVDFDEQNGNLTVRI